MCILCLLPLKQNKRKFIVDNRDIHIVAGAPDYHTRKVPAKRKMDIVHIVLQIIGREQPFRKEAVHIRIGKEAVHIRIGKWGPHIRVVLVKYIKYIINCLLIL